jgi:tetratricopeptide (TPR) repeat protein
MWLATRSTLRAVAALLIPLGTWAGEQGTDVARAHFGAGLRLAQEEAYQSAATEFEEALRLDPRLGEAREQLGVCYFQLRNYDAAREIFAGMLRSGDRNVATYYLARIDLINHSLDSAIRKLRSLLEPVSFRDAPYFLGVAYHKSERYDLAVQMLRSGRS